MDEYTITVTIPADYDRAKRDDLYQRVTAAARTWDLDGRGQEVVSIGARLGRAF